MGMESYKNAIREVCVTLSKSRNEIFTSMINVAMNGEYQEIDEAFSDGDIFSFELSHFADCKDVNLKLLHELIQKLESTYSSILNINSLDPADL